jgi:hypothetical protein
MNMTKGNDVGKKPIVRIAGISQKDSEMLISGLRELGKKIKDDAYREGIENALKMISDGRLPLRLTELSVESAAGEFPSEMICYALNHNDLSIFKELQKADVPKEAIDFVKNITQKYGFFFEQFRLALAYPDDWVTTHYDHYYDVGNKQLILRAEILKRNKEVIQIESEISSHLWLVVRMLQHIAEASTEAKKAMPKFTSPFEKTQISNVRKSLATIEEIFRKHSAKSETGPKVNST